ncbi:hypothetical protein MtrunA17_Chr2g0319381 [Medicago truncatula]|uniref:Uncharacterized protein n=1 Tax=Medicago truncatula TaxID=3880 RepID=A0A396JDX5_MEDTR|nr:hypothetical protein MtrunA17_Chr2g0319381 [Medicago truncatula]
MPPEPGQLKAIGLVSKVYSLSNVVALKQYSIPEWIEKQQLFENCTVQNKQQI